VRDALSISPAIPMITCDARHRESTKQALISLVEHVLRLRTGAPAPSIRS
jgi:hypothetical protein